MGRYRRRLLPSPCCSFWVTAAAHFSESVHAENKFLAPRSRIEAEVAGDAEVVAGAAEEVATNLLDMFSLHPQPKRQAAAVGLDAGGEVGAGHADVADAVWEKKATSSRGFLEKRKTEMVQKLELVKTETGQQEAHEGIGLGWLGSTVGSALGAVGSAAARGVGAAKNWLKPAATESSNPPHPDGTGTASAVGEKGSAKNLADKTTEQKVSDPTATMRQAMSNPEQEQSESVQPDAVNGNKNARGLMAGLGGLLGGIRSRASRLFKAGDASAPEAEVKEEQGAATPAGGQGRQSGDGSMQRQKKALGLPKAVSDAEGQTHILQVEVHKLGSDKFAVDAVGSKTQIEELVRAADIIGDASGGSDSDEYWMKRDRGSEHGADQGFANFGFLFGQHTNHHTLFDPALGFQIGTEADLGRDASGKPMPPPVIKDWKYHIVPVVVPNEAATFKNKGMSLLRVSGFLSTIVQGIGSGLTVAGALSLPLPFPVGPPTALAGLGLISLGSMIPKEQNEFLRMALIKRVKGGKGADRGEHMIQMHTLIEAVYKDSYGLTNNGIAYLLYREECPAHIQKELKSIEDKKDERNGLKLSVHKEIPFMVHDVAEKRHDLKQEDLNVRAGEKLKVYPCYLLEKNNGWLTMGEEYNVRALFSKGDKKTKTRLSWLWAKTFSWSEEHVGFKDKPEYVMKAWHFQHAIKEDTEKHRRSVTTEDLGQSKTHSLQSKLWYYPDSRDDIKEKEEQESAASEDTEKTGESTPSTQKGILGRIGSAIGGAFSAAKRKVFGKTHEPESVCDFLIYDSGDKDALRFLNAKKYTEDEKGDGKLGPTQDAEEERHLEVAFATEAVKQRVASRSMRLVQKVASGVSRRWRDLWGGIFKRKKKNEGAGDEGEKQPMAGA